MQDLSLKKAARSMLDFSLDLIKTFSRSSRLVWVALKKYLIICMETSVLHIEGFESDNEDDSTHKCRLKSHIHSSRAIFI